MFAAHVNPRTTRLASVAQMNGRISLENTTQFTTPDFECFELIVQRFLRKSEARGKTIFVAVAGEVGRNGVSTLQLPWAIDGEQLQEQFGFAGVTLVNEHVATARGIFEVSADHLFSINPRGVVRPGNVGVMAVDDTLEEVLMVRDGEGYRTFLTDGGHTGFAPATPLEAELWQYLYTQREVIEIGDIVSAAGLVRLYEFYLETQREPSPGWLADAEDPQTKIIEMALSGKDQRAVDAVDLLVDCFAGEAADLALRGVTTGGVYLGGRLVSELLPSFDQGRFFDNFMKRGAAAEKLAHIPITVLMDRNTALLGAARMVVELNEKR